MSFLTEYFDEFRQHPIKKTKLCRPEDRWVEMEGLWLDPKVGKQDKEWTDDEVKAFIKRTMKSIRGQSTYFNDYCSHLDQVYKYRVFKPREKKLQPCAELFEKKVKEEAVAPPEAAKLDLKDTELMKMAKELYARDGSALVLKPLPTHFRIHGYVRYANWHTSLTEYQNSTARLAYEMIRDSRLPPYQAHNGCRPRWGLPPEGVRQPELDGAPYDGERLY